MITSPSFRMTVSRGAKDPYLSSPSKEIQRSLRKSFDSLPLAIKVRLKLHK